MAAGWEGNGTAIPREPKLQERSSRASQPSPILSPSALDAAVHAHAGGNYRWVICALLFFATTINYMDRQVIAILKPVLQSAIQWNEIDYSNIIFAFQLSYAIALLFAGRIMDWLGTRRGYSLSITVWSLAAMSHALAHSALGI